MKMILSLEIKGMKMRMWRKRNKTRMLLCVTMKTRLHRYWGGNLLLVYNAKRLLMSSRWENDNCGTSYKLLKCLKTLPTR